MTYEELEKIRTEYNEKRKKYKNTFITIYCVIVGLLLIGSLPGTISSAVNGYGVFSLVPLIFTLIHPAIFLSIIYLVVSSFTSRGEGQAYHDAYKNYFVTSTMKSVFTNLQYNHKSGMPRSNIADTGMMCMGDTYASNDYCVAFYKDIPFKQADVHIQEEHRDSDGDRTYSTLFRGRWVTFGLKKKFDKKLLVVGRSFYAAKKDKTFKKIELESDAFNKRFKVFAQDGFEAFYLLDPAIMERITKLSELHNDRVMVCFADNQMHIAINNNIDSFEPPSCAQPIDEKKEFEKVMNDIKVITNIVDEVKLVK